MSDLSKQQVESLAYVMQFLYDLGFDCETVKKAADCWWRVKEPRRFTAKQIEEAGQRAMRKLRAQGKLN